MRVPLADDNFYGSFTLDHDCYAQFMEKLGFTNIKAMEQKHATDSAKLEVRVQALESSSIQS